MEVEECDAATVGTDPLVPHLEKENHHPNLPLKGHRPRCPHNVAKCVNHNGPFTALFLHLGALTLWLFNCLSNLDPSDVRAAPCPIAYSVDKVLLPLLSHWKTSFSVASTNTSHITMKAMHHLACWQLSAVSGIPLANHAS